MKHSDGRKDKKAIPAAMVSSKLTIIIPAYSSYEQLMYCQGPCDNSRDCRSVGTVHRIATSRNCTHCFTGIIRFPG